ncbi:MAG: protein kinase [Phycisphaerae bacterium]|nr:protein kinase [Phycisphaerae bacterium]
MSEAEGQNKERAGDEDFTPTASFGSGMMGIGEQIGRYKLLRILGEGGFGIVYLAEQQRPMKRQVALKIIKPGMDSAQVIRRFEAERQALALLDHPNVAHVYDAGTTQFGRPYFVMEYVKGVPITEHCDRRKLTIEERLKLFVKVCEAIQHAHQKGIIHRDIKPSNIQVCIQGEQVVPKVIDFGVAKALTQSLTERTLVTEQGQMIGTPEYISPEQAEMTNQDIDTRSDIYSLGVLLYELLTGTLPFESHTLREGSLEHMREVIREAEPKTPSTRVGNLGAEQSTKLAKCCRTDVKTIRRELRGDLDWITLKAMEKDQMRRYQTAHALAEDIERHLNHEPVLAGPPSMIYRMKKLLRKYRTQVVAFVAAVVLLAALATVSIMYLQGLSHTKKMKAIEEKDILSNAMEWRSKGQFQEALTEVESILNSDYVGPQARLLHARLILELQGPADAVKELEKLVNEREDIACQAHFLLARIYLESAPGDPETTEKYQQKAKEHQEKGEKLFSESAEAYFNRSMMAGTVNKTLEWLNKALEFNPGHYDSLEARTLAYYALKEYDRMEIDASVMIGNRPDDSQGYALRAIARREKAIREDEKGLLDQAINDHNKAIRISPKEAGLYDERRQTCMRMGNYEQVISDAQACVQLKPDEKAYHFNVFCALVALGRYDEAKAEYERIIKSGLMDKDRFYASAAKYVSDTLDAGLIWHPSGSRPKGAAFLAMHESTEIYQQLAKKARRVVPNGFRPTWSPDGTELAYSSGAIGFSGIEILNLASSKTRLLTVPGFDPAWSPDGRSIAFTRSRKPLLLADVAAKHETEWVPHEQQDVWLIKADGSEDPRFLAHGMYPSWSSDPSRVYYQSPKDWKLYSISVAGGAVPVPIVKCRGIFPVVSPDGRHVACAGSDNRLEILDLTTGSVVAEKAPMPSAFSYVGWSPNGQELSVAGDGNSGFWIYELDPTMQITKASKVLKGSFAWSSWSCPGMVRLAIDRTHYGSGYRDIWVADLDPNLSAAEALGPGQTLEQHYQEIIELYTRRIESDPKDIENYFARAGVYIKLGDKKKALEDLYRYAKFTKDPSRTAAAYSELVFSVAEADPNTAAELYSKAHEMQPENWLYLCGLSRAHYLVGRLEEAITELTESTKLPGGENSINYFSLSMAHWQLGEKEEATKWYSKAIEQMQDSSIDAPLRPLLDYLHSEASRLLGIEIKDQEILTQKKAENE